MCSLLSHRGPDEHGYYTGEGAFLGHRRLSIIDLETGTQPIFNEDKSIVLIINGEIYNYSELKEELEARNHSFQTHTDVEVVIHLYEEFGTEFLNKLNGMFAFCIWDKRKGSLFLARDRMGQKPLYYSFNGKGFAFSSELKSLLRVIDNRKLDFKALDCFFKFQYIPSPLTIFKNIKKLTPASFLIFTPRGLTIKKYWAPRIEKKSYSSIHTAL